MRTLFLGALLLGGLGCTNLHPIGPLARGKSHAPTLEKDAPEPVTIAAPKPVPPAMLIVPGEVTSDNSSSATQKLANEFEYDWKTIPPPSKTAEVSRYKGGVKQP